MASFPLVQKTHSGLACCCLSAAPLGLALYLSLVAASCRFWHDVSFDEVSAYDLGAVSRQATVRTQPVGSVLRTLGAAIGADAGDAQLRISSGGDVKHMAVAPLQSEPGDVEQPISQECHDFFAVVATMWEQDENCKATFHKLQDNVAILSAQMVSYGTTLHVFATRTAEERANPACQLCYPNVKIIDFEPEVLLRRHGFTDDNMVMIRSWRNHERRSDLYRLMLAKEHHMSYIDTDIVLVAKRPDIFFRPYIAACVWEPTGPAIEITNAAFCLDAGRLQRMVAFAQRLIAEKTHFSYTEFGPMLFMDTLLNAEEPITILSQNHPVRQNMSKIVREYREQGHLQFHLTGYIRGRWRTKENGYANAIQDMLKALGLPLLNVPKPGDGTCY